MIRNICIKVFTLGYSRASDSWLEIGRITIVVLHFKGIRIGMEADVYNTSTKIIRAENMAFCGAPLFLVPIRQKTKGPCQIRRPENANMAACWPTTTLHGYVGGRESIGHSTSLLMCRANKGGSLMAIRQSEDLCLLDFIATLAK